jgi:hypothetical protein
MIYNKLFDKVKVKKSKTELFINIYSELNGKSDPKIVRCL